MQVHVVMQVDYTGQERQRLIVTHVGWAKRSVPTMIAIWAQLVGTSLRSFAPPYMGVHCIYTLMLLP